MNLHIKLGLLFGSLTVLLIVSAALSYVLVKRIDSDVQNLGRVVAPLKEAALEMQISIGEGTKAIIQYSIDQDERHIRRFIETKIEFARALEEFTRLAETDEERDAGLRIGQIHDGLGQLSDNIIGVTNDIHSSLTRLSNDVVNIEVILNEQLEVLIDRNAPDGLTKLEAVLNMDIRLDEAFLSVQSYLASPDPRFRLSLREEEEEFKEFEAVFRSSQLSLNEEILVGVIDGVFVDAMAMGNRVMDRVDAQRNLLVRLADDLEKIDRIVNEEVHPLILAETVEALDSAEASVDVATLSVFILIALGAVVGVAAAAIVARQIVNPIVRLTNVAIELGQGNLGVRANAETGDEIGTLADSFNQMAAARERAEDQRVALISELESKNAELAQLDELKDNFLSSVSHELRTPLTAIKGSAEILLEEEGVTEETRKQFLTIINSESDRLTRLINDVLDLARYEAGQERWYDEPNSIGDIVESAVAGIRALAIQNNLDVSVSVDSDLLDVWCDADKINQVLTNLLSNAIKFTPENGKIQIYAKESFTAGSAGDGRVVEIRVSDTGIGIATEDLEEIFKKFKQFGDTPPDVHRGTGLGLPICKEIVDHYGGRIWAESQLGKGSVFIFTLPIDQISSAVESPPAEDTASSPAPSNQHKTILVVDDEANVRRLLHHELTDRGYFVLEASNGRTAIDLAREHHPDLIMMDVLMPIMDGYDATIAIRGDQETKDIPILVISIVEGRERGIEIGANEFVSKPFSVDQVLECVSRLLVGEAKKVLVVIDDKALAETIRLQLEQKGFIPSAVHRGNDVLDAIVLEPPDLIVLDLIMPEVDGFDILTEIKRRPETTDIPVIVLSGVEIDGAKVRALSLGAAEFVSKAEGLARLHEEIESILSQQPAN